MALTLGSHTIDVSRAAVVASAYGTGLTLDWSAATSTTVVGCNVQPVQAPEFTQDRDSIATRWQVWVPIDADVQATDRVTWNGDVYDVDGEPLRWDFGVLAHQVIYLRRSRDEAV